RCRRSNVSSRSWQTQPARELRQPAHAAHRLTREQRLPARHQIEQRETESAADAERRGRIAEEPDQAMRERADAALVVAPPIAIARERIGAAVVAGARVGDDLGERRDVAQREVEALPRDGMQTKRRVADEHDARPRRGLARDARELVHLAHADFDEAADAVTEGVL